MPVGILSLAENGSVQIDETHYCLSLKQKGSAVANLSHPVNYAGSTTVLRYVDITYSSPDNPVLAIRLMETNPAMYAGIVATQRIGNNWTFRVCVAGLPSQSFTFDYYIYDRPDWISYPGQGVALRDAGLKPIFNSNNPVMIVRGQQSGNYIAGRRYAFALTSAIVYRHEIVDNTPEGFITLETMEFYGAYCTNSGVQRLVKVIWGNLANGPNPPSYAPGSGLNGWGGGGMNSPGSYEDSVFSVIDVTNQ